MVIAILKLPKAKMLKLRKYYRKTTKLQQKDLFYCII